MAKRYDGYELDDDGNLIIDVTKQGRREAAAPLIDATREPDPVVDALTIDASRPGDFRNYTQVTPRAPGGFGERVALPSAVADIFQGADRSLMRRGAGGLRIVDPGMPEGGYGMRREAAGVSGDGRIVLSPEAIAGLGRTQLEEEQAAQAMQRTRINPAAPIIANAQAQADQGFLPAGTDLMRKRQMRGTLIDAREDWQDNNRPRDLMTRRNTADQIMTQADASRMTPQVMTQDGVATGWDPRQQKIVTDSSGARAMGAGRVKDDTITGMSDDDLNNRLVSLKARQIGELDDMDKLRVDGLLRSGDKAGAARLKEQLQKSKWSPDMQPFLDQYQAEWERRTGKKAGAGQQAAPAAGGKGGKWALK